jgi:hypothetical protein
VAWPLHIHRPDMPSIAGPLHRLAHWHCPNHPQHPPNATPTYSRATHPDKVLIGEVQELVELDTTVLVLLGGSRSLLGRSVLGVGEVSLVC